MMPMKKFGKFLLIWCLCLTMVLAAALVAFYCFLVDYQNTYDHTRPKLAMDAMLPIFEEVEIDRIIAYVGEVKPGDFENETHVKEYYRSFLEGKTISYREKAGEHIEERPVYVVTADSEPFAVVRLKKQDETAKYGLPLWEIREVELVEKPAWEYTVLIPENVEVTINGVTVTGEMAAETGIECRETKYFNGYAQIPTYNKYCLRSIYAKPEMKAVNAFGEATEVSFDEKERCYTVGIGGNEALRAELEDYILQAVTDYAMYVSNDAEYSALDKYFPKGSALLEGIKKNQREWFDVHQKPEIKNRELKEFRAYSEEAVGARVYLEQYMYVPFSGKTEVLITDINVYFVKQKDNWKITGIAFE